MIHYAEPEFWAAYDLLPTHVRSLADRNFKLLKRDHRHPSLHFKRVGPYWAVRVGLHYRALGIAEGDDVIWFWIGSHGEYEQAAQEISKLRTRDSHPVAFRASGGCFETARICAVRLYAPRKTRGSSAAKII